MAKAKILIRRCLLITLCGLATACSSVKQMPSYSNNENPILGIEISQPRTLLLVESHNEVEVPLEQNVPVQEVARTKATESLIEAITFRYKVSNKVATEIVSLSDKYAYADFPKQKDILAIVAVESRFNSRASLRGCYGLMQIQLKSHSKRLEGRSLLSPSTNIELGAFILNQYYNLLGRNKKAAILAYNSGIGNYQKGRYKIAYYNNYLKQKKLITS